VVGECKCAPARAAPCDPSGTPPGLTLPAVPADPASSRTPRSLAGRPPDRPGAERRVRLAPIPKERWPSVTLAQGDGLWITSSFGWATSNHRQCRAKGHKLHHPASDSEPCLLRSSTPSYTLAKRSLERKSEPMTRRSQPAHRRSGSGDGRPGPARRALRWRWWMRGSGGNGRGNVLRITDHEGMERRHVRFHPF
jgi:hypothetical protein